MIIGLNGKIIIFSVHKIDMVEAHSEETRLTEP